jgi:hypothetical protein
LNGKQAPDVYSDIEKKIHSEYNWKNSVDLYISHYESITCIKNEKNILILSMSCNIPYFKTLLATVKDTWAKPIIQNKYKNVKWFGYTACDNKHPIQHIDWEEHMIYVDCPDDINHTYEKTQKAYEMIKNEGVDFDYVVRTNTSVFVNVNKLIEYTKRIHNDDILGIVVRYYLKNPSGEIFRDDHLLPGLFIGLSREMFDDAMSSSNDSFIIPTKDDLIMSVTLLNKYKNLHYKSPNPNYNRPIIPCYKPYHPNDENINTLVNYKRNFSYCHKFLNNPSIINDNVVVQVRPKYDEFSERAERGHEFEHFYELYDALD